MLHTQMVDHSAIKIGQLLAIAALVAAYVLDRWEPVAVLAVIFLITSVFFEWGPFALLYRRAAPPPTGPPPPRAVRLPWQCGRGSW